MKFASPFCGCARHSDHGSHPLELDPCARETIFDAVLPVIFLIFSLFFNVCRRFRSWRLARLRGVDYDAHCLRLPTTKDAAILRRSLFLLVLILLEISCWAFLFAWRLESAILERNPDQCGTPSYQAVDPVLALLPRIYMLILVIKSFTTPADPVSPSKFTLYNPHFLIFYTLASSSAIVRAFSYFITGSDANWATSSTIEKSFAAIDLVICITIWLVSVTTPGELDQGELLDIDGDDGGILVLHDGRVVRSGRILSSEANASPLSAATFGWLNSLLLTSYRKALDDTQLWALPFRQRAKENYRHFKSLRGYKNLVVRIYRANRRSIHLQFVTAISAVVFHYANPYFLYKLLNFIQDPKDQPYELGYLYCAAIFICNIISTLVASQTLLWGRRWHVTLNNMLNSEIYAHTLRYTHPAYDGPRSDDAPYIEANEDAQNRQTTMLSQDAERLAELASYLHIFYTCPLEILTGVIFLYYVLGDAFLAGLVVMLIALPSTYLTSRRLVEVQKQLSEAKSWRTRLLQDLIENIRPTKFLAWERKWEQVISDARSEELVQLLKLYTQNTILTLIWLLAPVFVATISFAWYTLVDKKILDPSTAFVSIVLFSMLRDPLNVMPQAVMTYNDARVSLDHLDAFLGSKVTGMDAPTSGHEHNDLMKVGFKDAILRWPRKATVDLQGQQKSLSPLFTLKVDDLDFPLGCLSIVTGRPGDGKTSLLCALLGQMCLESGNVYLPTDDRAHSSSRVAYAAQTAWIENGTVRENITFLDPWDDARYRAVLYQCDLLRDLSLMENGDLTRIGDRGVPLTDVQKHKISLARAVYSKASVVLIDDILSSFDRHTANFIHDKCFLGDLLADRTVILAVNTLGSRVRGARKLVWLDQGRISSVETEDGITDWLEAREIPDGGGNMTYLNDDRIETMFESEPPFEEDELFDTDSVMRESVRAIEDDIRETEETRARRFAYTTYFASCGGYQFWICAIGFILLARLAAISESYWLKVWSSEGLTGHSVNRYIFTYLGLCLATVLCSFARTVAQYRGSLRASNTLFQCLLQAICRAPLQFFNDLPPDQILNRFSKDIETIDSSIGWHVNFLLQTIAGIAGVVFTIGIIVPEFIIACLIAAIAYAYIGALYIRASRALKKLNALTRPPILNFYTDTVAGLATIRAYGGEVAMMEKMLRLLDENMRPFYTLWVANRWLFVRVEFIGALLSLFIGIFLLHRSVSAGSAGIALTFATTLLEYIYWLMRQSTTVDMHFEAIERINEYMGMPQEPPGIVEGSRPPAAWPTSAAIQVRDLSLSLGADATELVLKHASFNIAPGEKVALIGRANAEKHAFVSCLFRFSDPVQGSVKVDGINIAWIGVEDLRSRITYVSNDGGLVGKTVRLNLDPFLEYNDFDLWQALDRVGLKDTVVRDLDMEIQTKKERISPVERQLLCVARAILRDCTNLVVLEEAHLSKEEEARLYEVMQAEFADSTLLVIPYRFQSILRYDKAMVFDQGCLVEFDTVDNLLRSPQGLLRSMMERSGALHSQQDDEFIKSTHIM
ncbi:ABC transporter type 1, transmembrane domain-containing protein [Syncephalastrum racemosum]|uniref:ABC transporter type 1, transmembrane domain-containing protein n=1 Tax=Syncephalastrum racemosum TaxID=13706 RepID=A0A1X2HNJ0_SYNRA|nr:ABC transporter type 1, transmembrane domain-containing protein [Syncephalastrum racemosum]